MECINERCLLSGVWPWQGLGDLAKTSVRVSDLHRPDDVYLPPGSLGVAFPSLAIGRETTNPATPPNNVRQAAYLRVGGCRSGGDSSRTQARASSQGFLATLL